MRTTVRWSMVIAVTLVFCLAVLEVGVAAKKKRKRRSARAKVTRVIQMPLTIFLPREVATPSLKSTLAPVEEFGIAGTGSSSLAKGRGQARAPRPPTASSSTAPNVLISAAPALISELRFRGPNGAEDEFIEIYNNTDNLLTVQASDASGGWAVVMSDGNITGAVCTIPNGTNIPARGHYLCANSNGYSLIAYPSGNPPSSTLAPIPNQVLSPFDPTTPDNSYDFDVPDGSGVALFSTTNGTNWTAATRLDAFGFTTSPALFREGAGFPTIPVGSFEHTFYRDLRNALPRDTDDNAADYMFVATVQNIQNRPNGAPGPENLQSPRVNNTIGFALIDPAVSSASPPNRERSPSVEPNADLGTLLIRRTVTNNTAGPITRLRFRIVNITTLGTPAAECGGTPCADLRALDSPDGTAVVASQVVTVMGLRLEDDPPEQLNGGGYNSSLSADFITLNTPLAPGASTNIEFKLGIMREGHFRFYINIEALDETIIFSSPPQ